MRVLLRSQRLPICSARGDQDDKNQEGDPQVTRNCLKLDLSEPVHLSGLVAA